MGTEDDDEITVETRLTKGDKVPKTATTANAGDLSALTGETRESKAKAYVAEATKEVAAQYIGTITGLKDELKLNDDRFAVMEKNFEDAMKLLAATNQKPKEQNELGSGLSEDTTILGHKER